jgi:polysaccharide biosynthesis protein PslH
MKTKPLNILFINSRLPYPLISGDRVKTYYLLGHLAKSHKVTLVSFYQGKEVLKEYEQKIRDLGVETITLPLNPITAGLNAGFNFFRFPLEIGYYTNNTLKKTINKLFLNKYDLAFGFFMRSAEYLKGKNITKILIAEDSRTLYQGRSYKNSRNLLQKFIRFLEYKKLCKYEPEIVNYFDIVTLVTQADIDQMTRQNPNAKYRLLTNGVNLDYFKPPESNQNRNGIIYSGRLDVYSNTMMAEIIIKELFPKIKKEFAEVTLTIAGAKAPPALTIHRSDSIKIDSDVPEILPYLQNGEIFLHPHNGASGIQNKLLEAMACGCAVVTTPTGIQGIPAIEGRDLLIGKNNEELISHTINILKNKELFNSLSRNARILMEKNFSWNKIFEQIDKIIDEVIS